MANINSYNQVISILKDIAERHYQINTFFLGKNWEIENTQDIVYPCLQVYPEVARMPQTNGEFKTLNLRFNCKVIDLVQQDQANQKDVHSDTLAIAQDIINELNQHPFYIRSNASLLGDIDLSNLDEYEDDFCAGWEFTLDIQLINNNSFCGLPMEDINGYSFPGATSTGYSTSVQYLTCASLTGCSTLQDFVSNEISDALTGFSTANYYTTGATLDGTTITFDRNDLAGAYQVNLSPALGGYLPITGGLMQGSIKYPQGTGADFYNAAGTQIKAGITQNGNTTFFLSLDSSATLVQAFDNITVYTYGGAGMKYAADYTPGFTNESLITKRYVDARIATATTTGNYLSLSGGTVTGDTYVSAGVSALTYTVIPFTGNTANSATTINTSISDNYTYSITSNTTFTLSNFTNGANKTIAVTQSTSSSGNTVAWTAGTTVIKWPYGITPVQTTTTGATDLYHFVMLNNTLYGTYSQAYY
jgi:hypothetical protein